MSSRICQIVKNFFIIFIILTTFFQNTYGLDTAKQKSFSSSDEQDNYLEFTFTKPELKHYRDKVEQFFTFALDNYLSKGYPYDEIRPLSCVPKTRNFGNLNDLVTNDVLGNFTITLLDSLTTIAVLGDRQRMKELVNLVLDTFDDFAIDSTVQVFETSIRIIGSLMSTHLYITDPRKRVYLGDEYDGESLLLLAKDIADRLLPAYMTKTGLPVSRINLLTRFKELTVEFLNENNAAGMASPMFEFTMLSYLTNDMKYERITRYAFDKIWDMRSPLDLIPMSFNPQDRRLYSTMTGVGASIDSFFEYALKGSILFDDDSLYEIWDTAYNALKVNCRGDWLYYNVDTHSGQLMTYWIDALSGFFPGLQTLSGDLEDAIPKHLLFMNLWDTFGGIPERWSFDISNIISASKTSSPYDQLPKYQKMEQGKESQETLRKRNIPLEWYPLRPEFIESTYFLYRATKDPFYLNIGVRIIKDLEERFMGPCGFSGIQNLYSGEKQDRMESFVLSETLKYLYLLFDEDNEIHSTRDNVIFSTEGHPLWLRPDIKRRYKMESYFNDTTWINHLQMCETEEIQYLERMNNEGSDAEKGFFQFAKRLLSVSTESSSSSSKEEEKGSRIINDDDQDKIVVSNILSSPSPQCTKYAIFKSDEPNTWLTYSNILSHYDQLFEISHRYEDTLIQPKILMENYYLPMALEPKFYNVWADPKYSQSRRQATTIAMDLIFMSMNGTYLPPIKFDGNSTIRCSTFQGRRKIRLEKIAPRLIDSYGDIVDTSAFQEVQRKDVYNTGCDTTAELYTPSSLYRAVKIDGVDIPKGYRLELPHDELFVEPRDENSSLGLNYENQMMLQCIPVINIYVK
ncbi:similar to Saccharomyces cerevisiae YHR204W MNL1 Alpha-1,2-specific exomannosidase of the endoplasmic reticulum [Maudiozyma barnettii]|uniref:alpha-1,2-Mannosidase n=1 Tax=Maudiozyma barnettii TaxID=61262 RepID=A0A8H2VF81_9SACH|nr:alpha-1,2-mannosidase MNL1 [Kazachstania barnettii]CAB4254431.1 similar to Saccharomyces cerevisiae YHR204W MNL1 Alpha-1,2-specific exomannosidase of the endoplasmic reticulum [Kazachstania barnettii]CAD1782373.1 similar to Saccharomyces cerevisiae YHR204W MNL1 Alpha-1,2-specific exomannosidase of the endoplasmic reticulum [Kazachstania barnettii]